MKSEKKETRGGARPGAGRPFQNKVYVGVKVSKKVADRLAQEPNKSTVVELALKDYFGIPAAAIE